MALTFRDLVDRRVPQHLAIYLGAGWGLVEFFSFLEERFSLSPDWTNILLFTWAMLIPSVVLLPTSMAGPAAIASRGPCWWAFRSTSEVQRLLAELNGGS
jgi:hypothetical protein